MFVFPQVTVALYQTAASFSPYNPENVYCLFDMLRRCAAVRPEGPI